MLAVGLCVDRKYLLPSIVSLISLADATPANDRAATAIRVITTDLTARQATTLAAAIRRLGFKSFDIRWDTPRAHWRIVAGDYISTATYLRFHFDKGFVNRPYLMYLDSDTLVLGDVAAPLNHIQDHQVGLVRDLFNHTVGRGPALPGVAQRWPDLKGRPYFNAGAMWCHVTVLPQLHADVVTIMSRAGRHIHFNDQDALNLWGLRRNTVQSLDRGFNTFEIDRFREVGDWIYRTVEKTTPPASPTILHFVGPDKPWHDRCPPTAGVLLYRGYLREAARLIRRTSDHTAGYRLYRAAQST